MNELTKTFMEALQKGFDSAKMISESKDKALAYASLANAIASTGLVEIPTDEARDTKDTKKKASSKNSLKKEASKEKKDEEKKEPVTPAVEAEVVEEEVAEEEVVEAEIVEENESEEEISEEWNEENTAEKAEVLERLNQYVEAWTEDYVYNECVNAWSEGAFSGAENIRPTNIDGFVAYLDAISESAE